MAPPLLTLAGATVRIGPQTLFAGLEVGVARGDRTCLVGRNGSGKSTLLKALAGLIDLDEGERFVQPRVKVASLPQEPAQPAPGTGLAEAVLGGLPETERGEEARYRAEIALQDLGMDPDRRADGLS